MNARRPLWKVSVSTLLEAEDAIAESLDEIFNCTASSYFDNEKKTSQITVYLPHKISPECREKLHSALERIKGCGLKIGPGKVSISKVRREDWAESWKRHFHPIAIGDALLIKPSWSKQRPRPDQAVVVLDPGLSFGTGQHATTLFCLEEIVRYSSYTKDDWSFLDIGTGSGILAIAAKKLGYKPVQAIDFDPEAVRVARANARSNGATFSITRGDVVKLPVKPKKHFDFICANLISNLLIAERKRIVAQLNHDGVLVLAGILKKEFSEVRREFEKSGLKLVASRSMKEWKSGSFCFE
jgi:ribosomal protein L11 methyltransferase